MVPKPCPRLCMLFGASLAFSTAAATSADVFVWAHTFNNTSSILQAQGNGGSLPTFATFPTASTGDVAADSAGNVYVAFPTLGTVQKFAPGSSGGTAFLSGLASPYGLAFDNAGNLFVSSSTDGTVRKFAADGSGGSTVASGLGHPQLMASDPAGNVYVGDIGTGLVTKITPDAAVSTIWHPGQAMTDLAVGPDGRIYVAQNPTSTASIWSVDQNGGNLEKWDVGSALSGFFICALAVDSHNKVYAVTGYQGVRAYSSDGSFVNIFPANQPAFGEPMAFLPPPPAPEPGSLALLGTALLAFRRRPATRTARRAPSLSP